eukprot:gene57897-biopygen55528
MCGALFEWIDVDLTLSAVTQAPTAPTSAPSIATAAPNYQIFVAGPKMAILGIFRIGNSSTLTAGTNPWATGEQCQQANGDPLLDTHGRPYTAVTSFDDCCGLAAVVLGTAGPSEAHANSAGPFTITGYGTVPSSCHSALGSTCTLSVCQTALTITADTSDMWYFNLHQNGADITDNGASYVTVSGGQHAWGKMDTDQYNCGALRWT